MATVSSSALAQSNSPQYATPAAGDDSNHAATTAFVQSALRGVLQVVNVKAYGALGDDSHDDTANIQAAFTASCVAVVPVVFPPGVYRVTGTITGCANQKVLAASFSDRAIIHRTGNFGDTLVFGTASQPALAVDVSGLWFIQGPIDTPYYTPGQTTLVNKASDGGAQIHIIGGQNVRLYRNTCWRGQYCVSLHGGSVFNLVENRYGLVWDHANAGAQEGIASVIADVDANGVNPKDFRSINEEYLGALSASRVATMPNGATHTMQEFVGPQYNIVLRGMETVYISSYLGDANNANLCLCPQSNGYIGNVSIVGGFWDGARLSQIQTVPDSGAPAINGLTIAGAQFNGEYATFHHILAPPIGTSPSVYRVAINGTTFSATYGSSMVLTGMVGAAITSNTITAYNSLNLETTDAQYIAGIYADNYSLRLNITGNTVGGGQNTFTQSKDAGNYAYDTIVIADSSSQGTISSSLVANNLNAGTTTP